MRRTVPCVVVIVSVAVVACGGSDRRHQSVTTSGRQETAGSAPVHAALGPLRVERLGCADGAPFPADAFAPGWRRRSVTAGPLTFYVARDLAGQPAKAFRSERAILRDELRRARSPRVRRRLERTLARMPRNGLGIAELLVFMKPGRHAATAVVPPSARRRLALVYSRRARSAERPGAAGIVRLVDGDRAVQFASCHGKRWHYLGGVIANRPGCVPIDVHVESRHPLRRHLPLGTGHHSCDP